MRKFQIKVTVHNAYPALEAHLDPQITHPIAPSSSVDTIQSVWPIPVCIFRGASGLPSRPTTAWRAKSRSGIKEHAEHVVHLRQRASVIGRPVTEHVSAAKATTKYKVSATSAVCINILFSPIVYVAYIFSPFDEYWSSSPIQMRRVVSVQNARIWVVMKRSGLVRTKE